MRRQEGKTRLRPGRLCLSALLAVAMAATLLCPGGTAALAEELPVGEVIELGEEQPANDQGQGKGQQNGNKNNDEVIELGEPEDQQDDAGDAKGADDVAVATQGEEPAVVAQNAGDAVASVTAEGTTTNYESFVDAVDAWKATDGATLTLLADVSGTQVPIVAGSRTLDLNGYGLRYDDGYAIKDTDEEGASLSVVGGRPDAEHRYTVSDYHATVDDTLEGDYQTFTGGYVTGQGGVFVTTASVTMEGVTTIGCSESGVYNDGAGTLVMTGCASIGNGNNGVYAQGGTLTMSDCHLSDCCWCGLYAYKCDVTMTGCTVSGTGDEGVYVDDSTATMTNCTVSGIDDEGVYVDDSTATMTNCTVSGNDDEGVYVDDSTATMTNCTVSGNDDEGVYVDYGELTMAGCTVSGNDDEGVYVDYGELTMAGCTVSGNDCRGVYLDGGTLTLEDTEVTGNSDSEGTLGVGVYVGKGQLSLKGAVEISGNKAGEDDSNLYASVFNPIEILGNLRNQEPIGVRVNAVGTFTKGLSGKGDLSNFRSEMGEDFVLSLTDEGECQFGLADGQVAVPASGNNVLDLRNEGVGHQVKVYDAAGKDSNYGNYWDGTLTVLPPAGKAVRVYGTVNTESGCDYFYVYKDYGPTEERRLAMVSGSDQSVDQTVADDPMLLRLKSDYSYAKAGLDLVVEVVDLPDDYVTRDKYNVNCEPAEHGSVSADKASCYEDKVVKLTLDPDEGYLLKSIKVTSGGESVPIREEVGADTLSCTFIMPAGNATVAAEFCKAATVTFLDADGTEVSSQVVTVGNTAKAPRVSRRKGARLVGWQVGGELFDIATPIEGDTTLTAVWEESFGLLDEDFDESKNLPDGWVAEGYDCRVIEVANGPNDGDWGYDFEGDEQQAFSGPNSVLFGTWSSGCTLTSPAMDLTHESNPVLSFQYNTKAWVGFGEDFYVQYRVGEEGEWKELYAFDISHEQTDEYPKWSGWQSAQIPLPQEACAKDVRIRFVAYSEDNGWGNFHCECDVLLDDVMVTNDYGHKWSYAKDGESRFVATCGNGPEVCTVDGATAAIELEAADAEYTGNPVEATVSRDNAWMPANGIANAQVGEVTYHQGSKALGSAPTQVGDYVAKVTVKVGETNYELTKAFSITPKVVGLKWSGTKLTYNGKSQAPKATATGLVAGDKCTVTVSGAAKAAGSYTATAAKLSNPNYALPAKATSKFTIAKAKLTVTAKNKTIKFGAAPANAGVTYSGFKGSDTAKSLGGKLSYDYGGYKKGGKAGTYKITPSGLTSKNYAIAYKSGRLTVEGDAPTTVPTIAKVRVVGQGWVGADSHGVVGTTGKSLAATGFSIKLSGAPLTGSIQYRAHVQGTGWEKAWSSNGKVCGTNNTRMEAVQMRLTGAMAKEYDVWYRVHVRKLGWMGWAKNGARAGTTGKSLRLEAVQVVVLKKGSKAPGATYNGVTKDYPAAFVSE